MTASTDIPISAELEARVRRATKRRLDGNGPVYLKYNSRRVAYDVSADGQRFVMIKEDERAATATQINVVLNWFEELKQKVPTGKK